MFTLWCVDGLMSPSRADSPPIGSSANNVAGVSVPISRCVHPLSQLSLSLFSLSLSHSLSLRLIFFWYFICQHRTSASLRRSRQQTAAAAAVAVAQSPLNQSLQRKNVRFINNHWGRDTFNIVSSLLLSSALCAQSLSQTACRTGSLTAVAIYRRMSGFTARFQFVDAEKFPRFLVLSINFIFFSNNLIAGGLRRHLARQKSW